MAIYFAEGKFSLYVCPIQIIYIRYTGMTREVCNVVVDINQSIEPPRESRRPVSLYMDSSIHATIHVNRTGNSGDPLV